MQAIFLNFWEMRAHQPRPSPCTFKVWESDLLTIHLYRYKFLWKSLIPMSFSDRAVQWEARASRVGSPQMPRMEFISDYTRGFFHSSIPLALDQCPTSRMVLETRPSLDRPVPPSKEGSLYGWVRAYDPWMCEILASLAKGSPIQAHTPHAMGESVIQSSARGLAL